MCVHLAKKKKKKYIEGKQKKRVLLKREKNLHSAGFMQIIYTVADVSPLLIFLHMKNVYSILTRRRKIIA